MPGLGKSGTWRSLALSASVSITPVCIESLLSDAHAGAARPAPERGFDPPDGIRVAFDERFDRAIPEVPDVARDPLVAGGVLDEVPEPDSLHPARDQIAPGNEHAPPL